MRGSRLGTFLGADAGKLAELPPTLRAEVIDALADAAGALASTDPVTRRAAASRIEATLGKLNAHHAERAVEKAFLDSLRPMRGDHAVMRKFAQRAGVGG